MEVGVTYALKLGRTLYFYNMHVTTVIGAHMISGPGSGCRRRVFSLVF